MFDSNTKNSEGSAVRGLTIVGWIWTIAAPILLIYLGKRSDNTSFHHILFQVGVLVIFIGVQLLAAYHSFSQITVQLALVLDFFVILACGIMVTLMYTAKPPKMLAVIGMGAALFLAGFIHRISFKKS